MRTITRTTYAWLDDADGVEQEFEILFDAQVKTDGECVSVTVTEIEQIDFASGCRTWRTLVSFTDQEMAALRERCSDHAEETHSEET
jgi:uncharacterized protein YrzB (UPF0473 family)